jgi:CBS domain-containing protein
MTFPERASRSSRPTTKSSLRRFTVKVNEVMTTDLGCCTMDTPLRQCAQMMVDCNCGAIPVVEDMNSMRLMGIITDRDIVVRAVAKGMDCETTRVADCMTTAPGTVQPEASLDEVERLMSVMQVRRVPVADNQGHLIGIVSQADLALAAPKPEVGEVVQDISRPYVR